MYTDFFGFTEKPFTLTPNPRFVYLSKSHKEAFAHLLYGINNHYGFIGLIGEVGTGKTTVLRTLLGQLNDGTYRTALIFNPCLTSAELLQSINNEFGISAASSQISELLAVLNRFLLDQNSRGRTVVLVIDEAQNLSPEVLEQIRLISNLETEDDKLIQIILAGQPELDSMLAQPELRQLNQRIAVRYRLRPMSAQETTAYIRHRLQIAGGTGRADFSRCALKGVYLYTRGVPRMINILCDRALLTAYGDERPTVTASMVRRAVGEILDLPVRRRLFRMAAVTATAAALLLLAVIVAHRQLRSHPSPAGTEKTAAPPAEKNGLFSLFASPPAPAALTRLEQELRALDRASANLRALNALLARWGMQPVTGAAGTTSSPDSLVQLAAGQGLRLAPFKGSIDDAVAIGIPFLVVTRVSDSLGACCLTVTAVDRTGASLSVSPPLPSGTGTVAKGDLAAVASGTIYLGWKNPGHIPSTISMGEHRPEVRSLQLLLKRAGVYRANADGRYGDTTAAAVRAFQKSRGIAPDNRVGEVTLAALARFDRGAGRAPSLGGRQPGTP